jgi:hypothetical protein
MASLIESLLTLLSTDRHMIHDNLNIQHPVVYCLGFAILPNKIQAISTLMDFRLCLRRLTWEGLRFQRKS